MKTAKFSKKFLASFVAILIFLVFWEIVGRQVNPIFLSFPSQIIQVYPEIAPELWDNFKITANEFGWGFLLSVIIGLGVGVAMGISKVVEGALEPFVNAIYAIPRIVFIPLIVLWFGVALEAKIALTILLAVFPIIINTFIGIKNVDKSFLELGEVFRANNRDKILKIWIPASLPFTIAGLRLGLGMAIIGVVLGEFFTELTGLGYLLISYGNRFQTDKVFAVIIIIGIVSVVLTEFLKFIERKIAPWKNNS